MSTEYRCEECKEVRERKQMFQIIPVDGMERLRFRPDLHLCRQCLERKIDLEKAISEVQTGPLETSTEAFPW